MTPTVPADISERRAALRAVLSSKEFSRSPALARLLTYLCQKTFEGKVHEIKEFSIATEVYGRTQEFADKRDSIVRVEVSRLRKRLQRFYEEEGVGEPFRIVIPAGTYQPEFDVAEVVAPLVVAPRKRYLPFVIGLAVLAAVGVAFPVSRPSAKKSTPATEAAAVYSSPTLPIRILAGSKTLRSVDRFGSEWSGDRYFIGGEQNRWELEGREMGVPVRSIVGAPDQLLFRTFRFGSFSYKIPLPEGKYEMRLYFSEVIFLPSDLGDGAENRRVFDVVMNGKPILKSFDIAADAGAPYTAAIRVFENVSPEQGFLHLDFHPILSGAWLNAIEIIPNATGKALPVRLITRNANITDHNGDLWGIDRYYAGGRQISDNSETVSGTADPELFQWQRYGSFTYRIPVPPGKYRVRLLFSETYFGPTNRGKGGAGSRVFNVYCAGLTLLHNFEIFKQAGSDRALEKVFHGISPGGKGRIDLTFEPVVNYALVRGIEITPE